MRSPLFAFPLLYPCVPKKVAIAKCGLMLAHKDSHLTLWPPIAHPTFSNGHQLNPLANGNIMQKLWKSLSQK